MQFYAVMYLKPNDVYIVSQKVAPKVFLQYFDLGQVYFAYLLPIYIQLYPNIFTNFGWFILIFSKMALSVLRVLIIFTIASFVFRQVRLLLFHRQWRVAPNSSDVNPLDFATTGRHLFLHSKSSTRWHVSPYIFSSVWIQWNGTHKLCA